MDTFIKAEEDKYVNTKYIRWIQEIGECYYTCSKMNGCNIENTHKICKSKLPKSYEKIQSLLNK